MPHFALDGPLFVRERRNGGNLATCLVGPRGPEYRRDDQAGTVRWYCFDGLGSVVGEVDTGGNLTATRNLDVYGSVRSSTGVSASRHKFVGSLGHTSEDETGLVYMQARYMDPAIGRFLSQDTADHGANWFSYASNNPVNRIDRSGHWDEFLSGLAGFLMGMLFGFMMALGEFFVKQTTESLTVFWLFVQSVGGGVLAFYGELTNLGALSNLLAKGQIWRFVRAVGVTGFVTGALGAAIQVLYGYHAGQIGLAMTVCEYDMEHA